MKTSVKTVRTSGFALTLLIVTAVVELAGVAFGSLAFGVVSEASPLGGPGTAVAIVVIAVVAVIGTLVAWRGATGVVRAGTAIVLFVAVGIIAVLGLFLLAAGGAALIFAILLFAAAVLVAMIAQAVLRSAPSGTGR